MSAISGTGPGGGGGPIDSRRRRAASVTLRHGEAHRAQSVGDLMDPANKSLADALRIAYRLLLVSIVVMLVLFVLSGIQQVGTTEVGMRVTLGDIVARNLPKGLVFSWPQPLGDVIKMKTTDETVDLRKEFFPSLSKNEEDTLNDPAKRGQGLAEGGRDFLDPDADGALMTADGFMVHTRWQVTYKRSDTSKSLENIVSDAIADRERESTERQIVRAAARRGVVHAAARMTVDEVLYNQPAAEHKGTFRPINVLAKQEAQKLLTEMDLGLEIQQFTLSDKIPPRFVIKSFNDVQSAQSRADADRSKAQEDAQKKLAEAAGEGAPIILGQIDAYESELALNKTAEAGATLQTIHDLMLRKPVTIDGKPVLASVSGEVSKKLSDATQYRTSVVSRAKSDASAYATKLSAFKANPQVYLSGEWTGAYSAFAARDTVSMMLLPQGLERLVIQINKDPQIEKDIRAAVDAAEAKAAAEKRKKEHEDEVWRKRMEGNSIEGTGGG